MNWKILLISLLVVTSCKKSGTEDVSEYLKTPNSVPIGFPEVDVPSDNQYSLQRWQLGKKLFFEKRLSRDSTISCASCHHPSLAFSDNVATSRGVGNMDGSRNSPSLANVAYHPYLTREGGVPTLEMQVLVPIQEHNEFDFNIVEIVNRLQSDDTYQKMSADAYDRPFDYFVITRAIACFERTLLSGNSQYDKYKNGNNALSLQAKRGMELFFSERTQCSTCHSGFNFTNYTFENNGLYEKYEDVGRFRLTKMEKDKHLFKVPGLRNIALTAPYMHDGSFNSLEEVIDHYDSGGVNHPQKSKLLKPLNLNQTEKADLISFLYSLTDYEFVENPLYHDENEESTL